MKEINNRNRLNELGNNYPRLKPQFKQFFRDNGVGDLAYSNVEKGRQKLTSVHDKIIDRLLIYFQIEL